MNNLSLTFGELNADQARMLMSAYEDIVAGAVDAAPSMEHVAEAAATVQAPAAVAPSAPAVQVVDETDVDAFGVPWHAEHHAGTKRQKADGSWTRRKGADTAAADAYEAQYKTAPASPAALPAEAVTVPPVAPPAAPAMPGMLPLAPSAPAAAVVDYEAQLLPLWTSLNEARKLPLDGIEAAMREHGAVSADGTVDYTRIASDDAVRGAIFAVLQSVQ